jgi:hypothetical protein
MQLERISASDAGCTRIRQTPGIGPIVATAIVAAIGNGAAVADPHIARLVTSDWPTTQEFDESCVLYKQGRE